MRKIVGVASDVGESNLLKTIGQGLESVIAEDGKSHAFDVELFLGEGKRPFPHDHQSVDDAIRGCDVVIVTMSDHTAPEVAACKSAIKHGKKLALVALGSSFTAHQKEAFADIREHVDLIFIITEPQMEETQKLFPNAHVVASGNPDWENFFSMTPENGQAVRDKLNLDDKDFFLLVIGDKKISINVPLAVSVIEAVPFLDNPEEFHIVFSVHPGHEPLPGSDKTPSAEELIAYYEPILRAHDQKVRVDVSCKAVPFGIGSSQMVPAADIVLGGNSTILIESACQRIPAIAILMRAAFSGVELPKYGSWWQPCDWGAILEVRGIDSESTAAHIISIFDSEFRDSLIEDQEKAFPAVEPGTAINKMIGAIQELAG